MTPRWLRPASVLSFAIRLTLTHRATIRTHRRPEPKQYALWQ